MAGKSKEVRIAMLESKLNALKENKQMPRIQVVISPDTRKALEPLFMGRKGGPILVKEAEKLTLLQAVRYLSLEKNVPQPIDENGKRGHPPTVGITPTAVLLEHAERFFVGPHVLVRAAAVKLARKLRWMEQRGKREEYAQAMRVGVGDRLDGEYGIDGFDDEGDDGRGGSEVGEGVEP